MMKEFYWDQSYEKLFCHPKKDIFEQKITKNQ